MHQAQCPGLAPADGQVTRERSRVVLPNQPCRVRTDGALLMPGGVRCLVSTVRATMLLGAFLAVGLESAVALPPGWREDPCLSNFPDAQTVSRNAAAIREYDEARTSMDDLFGRLGAANAGEAHEERLTAIRAKFTSIIERYPGDPVRLLLS